MASDNSKMHPYLRPHFYLDPANQFWEVGNRITEEGKNYYRRCVEIRRKQLERINKMPN